MEKLYTVKEACELLKLTRQTLWNYCKEGKIEVVKIGTNIRIKESELKKLINN